MRTDGVAVALRPRTDWEAVDLGLELGRAWFAPIATAWSMAYMMPALLLVAGSPWPIATALVVWLLRPWSERAVIEVLARRAFHQPASLGHALRAVLRAPLRPGAWLASLTWRRLSPVRAAWLTVWQLEGLRGPAARARIRTLTARGYGVCAWCGLLGWGATLLLTLSGIMLALSLLPDATGAGVSDWLDGHVPLALRERRTWSLILIAADGLCAPWVLVAQFGWYLTRRTDLEAWDVELVFRALARRATTTASLLFAMLAVASVGLQAQTVPASIPTDESRYTVVRPAPTNAVPFEPRHAIDAILKHPDFGRDEVVQQWRLKPWSPGTARTPPPWMAWLAARMGTLAGILRVVMWVIAGVVIAWLIRLAWRARGPSLDDHVETAPLPEFDFATPAARRDVHVVRAALDAIDRGALLEALGLLYRGALVACADRGVIDIQPGDTEGEYLRQIEGRLPVEAERTVRSVVRAWQAAAYARRLPSAEQARAMCEAYRLHVAGGPS